MRRGLVAIVDIRGSSVELKGCCRDELVPRTARAVQRVLDERVAERIAGEPAVMQRLCDLAHDAHT